MLSEPSPHLKKIIQFFSKFTELGCGLSMYICNIFTLPKFCSRPINSFESTLVITVLGRPRNLMTLQHIIFVTSSCGYPTNRFLA